MKNDDTADPTKAFYQFAAQMRFDKKVKGLSLGQGQGLKATRLIEEASQKGTWVSRITRPLALYDKTLAASKPDLPFS